MPAKLYTPTMTTPVGVVAQTGSRCQCSECFYAFAGEDAFNRHRVGTFEPDERRCLPPEAWASKGLHIKDSRVVGRYARRSASPTTRPPSREVVLRLARAVIRPGGNALRIDEGNHGLGWQPLEEAVASGQAFAVEVDPAILAIDADGKEMGRIARSFADSLPRRGIDPVLLASGRPGHRHIFARIPDRTTLQGVRDAAKAAGLDVRRPIRPPLSPHRLPDQYGPSLIRPTDPGAALRLLEAT